MQRTMRKYALEARIPFLTNRLATAFNELFLPDLVEYELTIANWRVLTILDEFGDQRLVDLAQHTSIDASTLSRIIEAMHRRHLVTKIRSNLSKREILVSLADCGRDIVEVLTPRALAHESAILDGLPSKDIETTGQMLRLMYEQAVRIKNPKIER